MLGKENKYMPNYCNYEMKIKGDKDAIKRVVDCLKAKYNYHAGTKPSHKHFCRVFQVEYKMESDNVCFIYGNCAWSVYSCMLNGENTYYNSIKKDHKDIFMGTTLLEQSKDCEIEVFSEEEGMGFSEHYRLKNGKYLVDETVDIEPFGYTKTGKPTTDVDWETYEGDFGVFNPHRKNMTENYLWNI